MSTGLCPTSYVRSLEYSHQYCASPFSHSYDFEEQAGSETVRLFTLPKFNCHLTDFEFRKVTIIVRMGLPLLSIILTIYQLPTVISHLGRQQFRTLVASFDILLATFISNAVVLGSLLQDRGYKKTKYKHGDAKSGFNARKGSATAGDGVGGLEGRGGGRFGKVAHERWGSDEDLMRTSSGGDKGSVVIGLEELPSPTESARRKPDVPPKAKFPEIRVASTWEIQVDRRDPKD